MEIGFTTHDGTYSIDFAVQTVDIEEGDDASAAVMRYCFNAIRDYERDHGYKFVGGGIMDGTRKLCPELLPKLWSELDIVCLHYETKLQVGSAPLGSLGVDEESDSMVRKATM